MNAPQDGKSALRGIVRAMTTSHPGKDDYGETSCVIFFVTATLFWLPVGSGLLSASDREALLPLILAIMWLLVICGTVVLGTGFAVAGIVRAMREKRVPFLSLIGLILNVAPSGFLFLIFFLRA